MMFDPTKSATEPASHSEIGNETGNMIKPPARPTTADDIIRAGKELLAAKRCLNRQFEAWVTDHCPFSVRSARNYMARAVEAMSDAITGHVDELRVADTPELIGWRRMTDAELDTFHLSAVRVLRENLVRPEFADPDEWIEQEFPTALAEQLVTFHPHGTASDVLSTLERLKQDNAAELKQINDAIAVYQQVDPGKPLWFTSAADDLRQDGEGWSLFDVAALDAGNFESFDLRKELVGVWRWEVAGIMAWRTGKSPDEYIEKVQPHRHHWWSSDAWMPCPDVAPSSRAEFDQTVEEMRAEACRRKVAIAAGCLRDWCVDQRCDADLSCDLSDNQRDHIVDLSNRLAASYVADQITLKDAGERLLSAWADTADDDHPEIPF